MDAKNLRVEPVLGERNDCNTGFSLNGASATRSDQIKPLHEVSPTCISKMDVQTVRPCAVIGPDRIVPQPVPTEPYLKKAQPNSWDYSENAYGKPPDYSKNVSEQEIPLRNISPRQTFQESMHRITVPPRGSLSKLSENPNNFSDKNYMLSENVKYNIPIDYEVPYNYNTVNNIQRGANGIAEMSVPQNNLAFMKSPHGWPMSMETRQYMMPEVHRYTDYPNGNTRPVPVNHPMHEDGATPFPDPYSHSGNLRFQPYPSSIHRLQTPRYDCIPHYSNRYNSAPFPPQHASYKYSMQKKIASNPYVSYPRLHEPQLDRYQRDPNHLPGFNLTYQGQSLLPNYNNNAGNCVTKINSYSDSNVKPLPPIKGAYENSNKAMIDYDPTQVKPISVNDHSYVNEIRSNSSKGPMMSHYPPVNINIPTYAPYYRKENHPKEYGFLPHYNNIDNNINNMNSYSRFPPAAHYPPSIIAHDSQANNTFLSHNYGNLSQNSSPIDRNVDYYRSKYLNHDLRKHEYRYGAFNPISLKQDIPINNQPKTDKKSIDVRQFLQMWNEGDDEHNDNKSSFAYSNDSTKHEMSNRQEELYVLGLVNVPNEELKKYDHIQKISKLPENIKGYNSFDLLSQFEEVVEASSISTTSNTPTISDKPAIRSTTIKQTSNNVIRPLSPLDVEAKITQSIIHKDCSFEIKPCSPKMLNVEIATPAQSILNERAIEKVTNPSTQSLNISKGVENILIHEDIKTNKEEKSNIPSCKMVNTSYSIDNDHKSNYNLNDLENDSGVCLASLPQLDTDIEFNFAEVNQQFLAANKTEKSDIFDPIQNYDADNTRNDYKGINLIDQEKKINPLHNSEKSISKLSKFRKIKVHHIHENAENNINIQSMRTDSVIIKNPDSTEKSDLIKDTCDLNNIIIENEKATNRLEESLMSPINLSYQPKSIDLNTNYEKTTLNSYDCAVIANCDQNTKSSISSITSGFTEQPLNETKIVSYNITNHSNNLATNTLEDNSNKETLNLKIISQDKHKTYTNCSENVKSDMNICDQITEISSHKELSFNPEIRGNISEKIEDDIPQYPESKDISINTESILDKHVVDTELETMINEDCSNRNGITESSNMNEEFKGNITKHNITRNTQINNGIIDKCINHIVNNHIENMDPNKTGNNNDTSHIFLISEDNNSINTASNSSIPDTNDEQKLNTNDEIKEFIVECNDTDKLSSLEHSGNLKTNENNTLLIDIKEISVEKHCSIKHKIPKNKNNNCAYNCNHTQSSYSELFDNDIKRLRTLHSNFNKELFSPQIQNLIYNEISPYYNNLHMLFNDCSNIEGVIKAENTTKIKNAENIIFTSNKDTDNDHNNCSNGNEIKDGESTTELFSGSNILNPNEQHVNPAIDGGHEGDVNVNDESLGVDNILVVDHSCDEIRLSTEAVSNNNEVDSIVEVEDINNVIENGSLHAGILQIVEIDEEKYYPLLCKKEQNKLKRSLSESSIFYRNHNCSNQYVDESKTNIQWHSKRRKINQCGNVDQSNISNFSRRNSTSIIQTDDIAVCIYISNDYIVAEPDLAKNESCESLSYSASELNESSKIFENESSRDFLPKEVRYENLTFNNNEDMDFWVDDIACVETVVTDNNINEDSYENCIHVTSEVEQNSCLNVSGMSPVHLKNVNCTNNNNLNDEIKAESPNVTLQHFYGLNKITSNDDNDIDNMHLPLDSNIEHYKYAMFQDQQNNFAKDIVGFKLLSPIKNDIDDDESDNDNTKIDTSLHVQNKMTLDETIHSCESSNDSTIQKNRKQNSSSSSPEVTSTTEEKKSGIFLKITNYKGSRVSVVDDGSRNLGTLKKPITYKYPELNYSDSKNVITKPLITKAAKKYIPPSYDYQDFRVKLYLPLQKLVKLKELKTAKEIPKNNHSKRMVQNNCKLNIRKIKPNFEDVLKSIDELQFNQKNKKSPKKIIPKVVIKKNGNGSHYASTSKTQFNPDMTGRKWQPWVFIEKNHFVDKMAIRNKRHAVYCHKKRMYTIIDKIRQQLSHHNSTNYCNNEKKKIDLPKVPLKYTI